MLLFSWANFKCKPSLWLRSDCDSRFNQYADSAQNRPTLNLEWRLCVPDTFSHCSCCFASTWRSLRSRPWSSTDRCDPIPSLAPTCREPTNCSTCTIYATHKAIFLVIWRHTCNMVSKLNVIPFHRVNSPLEAPVIKRLPSGVHWKQKN